MATKKTTGKATTSTAAPEKNNAPVQAAPEKAAAKAEAVVETKPATAAKPAAKTGLKPAPDGGMLLAVDDSGYGIPAAHLSRITERFYRVSTSRSRESGGTGLGLAIVKHVLGLHGARLDITSEVGKGSEFACRFAAERVIARDAHTHAMVLP